MLRADIVVVELTGFFEGEFDHALRARREDHLLLDGLTAAADDRFDFLANFGQVDAERLQQLWQPGFRLRK